MLEIRSISSRSWSISFCEAARSSTVYVSFAFWTASSRIRCNIAATSFNAPSAVCTIDCPSSEFLDAWFNALICVRILLEIASPAESSAAFVILYPELNFSRLAETLLSSFFKFTFAICAVTLWLIFIYIPSFLLYSLVKALNIYLFSIFLIISER